MGLIYKNIYYSNRKELKELIGGSSAFNRAYRNGEVRAHTYEEFLEGKK